MMPSDTGLAQERTSIVATPSLPPELWLEICKMLVPTNKNFCISTNTVRMTRRTLAVYSKEGKEIRVKPMPPPISQVCRLLRRISLEMYYKQNFFCTELELDEEDRAMQWLVATGPVYRSMIGKLYCQTVRSELDCGPKALLDADVRQSTDDDRKEILRRIGTFPETRPLSASAGYRLSWSRGER